MKAIRKILAAIRKADHEFGLIKQGDKIMVGVSGGKDSLVLCYALKLYQKFPHTNFSFQPMILDLGFPNSNIKKLQEDFKKFDMDLLMVDCSEIYKILTIQKKDKENLPCSICSRMKKAAINKAAKELGYTKVAFAHHADDAIETIFMNEMYGGRIATFAPFMHLENANIDFVRPLIYCRESDIEKCAKELNLPIMKSTCPNDKHTMRQVIKDYLVHIYKEYPFAKENFLRMLTNNEHLDIWTNKMFESIEGTDLSYHLVTTKNDALLAMNYLNSRQNNVEDLLKSDIYLLYKKYEIIGAMAINSNPESIAVIAIKIKKNVNVYNVKKKFINALNKKYLERYPNAKRK